MAKDTATIKSPTTASDTHTKHNHDNHKHHDHTHDDPHSPIAPNTVITLTIAKDDAQKAYAKALRKLATSLKSSGFRKGKTPPKIAEEMLDRNKIIEVALEKIVPDLYIKEIAALGKKPLTRPEFVVVSATENEDWVIEAHIAETPELDVTKHLDIARKAKKEGEKVVKAKIEEHTQATKDETPKNTTVQEGIRRDILLQHIYQALITEVKPRIPELLLKEEASYDLRQLVERLKQHNSTLDTYIAQQGITFEQLSQSITSQALGKLQLLFIIDTIASMAKIEIVEQDIDDAFAKMEANSPLQQYKNDRYYRNLIRQSLLRERVADLLLKA